VAIVLGVVILIGGVYGTQVIHRERDRAAYRRAALHDSLATMRKAIDNFHADHKRHPRSLDELVPNYIRRIPADPVTGSTTSWKVTTEQSVQPRNDFTTDTASTTDTYIVDVHSGARGADANGVPYAEY
jgi:hypothetical protein